MSTPLPRDPLEPPMVDPAILTRAADAILIAVENRTVLQQWNGLGDFRPVGSFTKHELVEAYIFLERLGWIEKNQRIDHRQLKGGL